MNCRIILKGDKTQHDGVVEQGIKGVVQIRELIFRLASQFVSGQSP
jgi:hypothetical protein